MPVQFNSMSIKLEGLLLPITTPFTADETVDIQGLKTNLERWIETSITGIVVMGSTGERVNLEQHEYLEVVRTARALTPDTMTFVVGAGQHSTHGTIKEIQQAADAGADAVLVLTPHYYRSAITQDALREHYTAVADNSLVPIILYSMPALTGIKIEPETAAYLSGHEKIIGMKDSSNDIEKFGQAVQTATADFAMLIGNGTVFFEALQAGARGGILAVGCVAVDVCVEIFKATKSGDTSRASALQQKLTPLARAVTKTYGVGGLKTAMDMAGFAGGSVRRPLRLPNETARAEIKQLMLEAAVAPALAQSS